MGLKDLLNQPEPSDARRKTDLRDPEVRFSASGDIAEVVLPSLHEVPEDEAAWRHEITRVTGLTVPEHRQVNLKSVRFWGDQGAPYVYARFDITDRPEAVQGVDGVQILKDLRSAPRKGTSTPRRGARPVTDAALVTSWADWQTGLTEGGGTPAFLGRLDEKYDLLAERATELGKLGRRPAELVIIGGGDMIEGCAMRPNHAFELDLDRRGQIRTVTACILDGLDRLAPMFSRVRVLVVGGNHGENRVDFKFTTRHDNDDCAVFEHAALAAERDKRLGHVEFYIARDEIAKTIEVNGWVLGTTHGQAYGKGTGGSIEAKVWKWFSGQAAGRRPVGDSDVLVTHHFHHLAMKDFGGVQWVQAPALDGGSAWYQDSSGLYSEPGMLSFLMTPEKRMQDLQVL